MARGANQYTHPKPAENLPPLLSDDLWTLSVEVVKASWEPESWLYLNQLHRKRAEGRLSDEAYDCAFVTHVGEIVKQVAATVAG